VTECCCQVSSTPSYVLGPDRKFGLETGVKPGKFTDLALNYAKGNDGRKQPDYQFPVQDLNSTHVLCKVVELTTASFASSGSGVVQCDKPSGV